MLGLHSKLDHCCSVKACKFSISSVTHHRRLPTAGERRKRQQAASLGVSPTVVARSQMSARNVAQQQVLTQRQRREAPAAVAQQAAAEKLQMEQQALERDYEQLRQDRLRSVGNSMLVNVNLSQSLSKRD